MSSELIEYFKKLNLEIDDTSQSIRDTSQHSSGSIKATILTDEKEFPLPPCDFLELYKSKTQPVNVLFPASQF